MTIQPGDRVLIDRDECHRGEPAVVLHSHPVLRYSWFVRLLSGEDLVVRERQMRKEGP